MAEGNPPERIAQFSSIRSLLVRPTSAILKYRDPEVDAVRAGRELSAEAVISGSLQRSGSRLRVSVQVHATADGRAIWATKIDSSLDDVFRMQDEVSREIVRSLEVRLTRSDERLMEAAAGAESRSQTHHVRGRLRMMHESIESLEAAIQEFQRAVDIDPGFAKSYAGLAAAYARMGFTFRPDEDYYVRAEMMLNQALALDPDLPEARYIRGWLSWTPRAEFQHEVAIRELGAATRMAPGLYEAYDLLAIVLLHVSLLDESTREFERALDINPQDVYGYMHFGLNKYCSGDWSAASEISQEAWRRAPSAWAGYQFALTQVQLGLLAEAEQTAAAAERHFPNDVLFHPLRGLIAALRGDDRAAARQIELTIAHRKAYGHYHHAQYDVACIHALSGRQEEAMTWLTAAARNGFPCHGLFARDRLIRPLHDLPAFSTLLEQLKRESDSCRRAYRESREPQI